MTVQVRLFAVARELAGAEAISLELPAGSNIAELRRALAERVPALATVLPHVLFAVGSQYMRDETLLADGAEVACIPPVSGG